MADAFAEGRMTRRGYWIRIVISLGWVLGFGLFDYSTRTPGDPISRLRWSGAILCLVALWVIIVTCMKRLHDMGRSAGPFYLLMSFALLPELVRDLLPEALAELFYWALAAAVLAGIGFLRCKPGEQGPNRFGPDRRVRKG